jgi:hypothetical protein
MAPLQSSASGVDYPGIALLDGTEEGLGIVPGKHPRQLAKTLTSPKKKRPRWIRLSKTNVGFPPF